MKNPIEEILKEFDNEFHLMTVEWDNERKSYIWPQSKLKAFLRKALETQAKEFNSKQYD